MDVGKAHHAAGMALRCQFRAKRLAALDRAMAWRRIEVTDIGKFAIIVALKIPRGHAADCRVVVDHPRDFNVPVRTRNAHHASARKPPRQREVGGTGR